MMDEEERDDSQMRERFKAKWTPKPSGELTVQLRQEAEKYRGIMENAMRADGVVREKYNKHRRHMDLLSKGSFCDDDEFSLKELSVCELCFTRIRVVILR